MLRKSVPLRDKQMIIVAGLQLSEEFLRPLTIMLCYAKSLQSCPTLCDPVEGSPTGSPVPGILQARTLEWGAISFSNAWKWKVKVKSCLTLSHPMDCRLPGSSVHGILQARALEWGAIAFSERDTTTCVFTAALLTIAKIWK